MFSSDKFGPELKCVFRRGNYSEVYTFCFKTTAGERKRPQGREGGRRADLLAGISDPADRSCDPHLVNDLLGVTKTAGTAPLDISRNETPESNLRFYGAPHASREFLTASKEVFSNLDMLRTVQYDVTSQRMVELAGVCSREGANTGISKKYSIFSEIERRGLFADTNPRVCPFSSLFLAPQ